MFANIESNRQLDIISGYGCLWKVFRIFGISVKNQVVYNRKYNVHETVSAVLCYCSFLLCAAYSIANLWFIPMDLSSRLKISLPLTLTNILSNFLWLIMYKRRSCIRNILLKMQAMDTRTFNKSCVINAVICVFVVFVVFYLVTCLLMITMIKDDYEGALLLGWKVEFDVWGNIIRFLAIFVLNTNIIITPTLVAIALCFMYLHCAFLLCSYEHELKYAISVHSVSVDLIRRYSRLMEIVKELDQVLSFFAFVLSALVYILMFSTMAVLIEGSLNFQYMQYIVANSSILLYCTTAILSMMLVASSTPSRMRVIRYYFENLYENLLYSSEQDQSKLKMIQHIMLKEVVCFSACDMFSFSKKNVLSFFGGFFTYGLLFININA